MNVIKEYCKAIEKNLNLIANFVAYRFKELFKNRRVSFLSIQSNYYILKI